MTTANEPKPLILITGSSGLIGARAAAEFSRDFRVIGLDVNPPDTPTDFAEWKKCDLTDDESVTSTLKQVRDDHGGDAASVIHLAAYYDFSGEPSPLYRQLTVEGTRRLLTALAAFERVEQLIFSSSLLVMKPAEEETARLTEASPTEPAWDYPRSKLEAERLLAREHGALPVVILRLAGVYTEDCQCLPIAQQIRRIHEKQPESYVFPGDADHGQPFVHLDDVADCLRRAVESRRTLGAVETFLIAEPEVLSYRDLQKTLGQLIHGKEWPAVRIPKPVAVAGAWAKEIWQIEESFIKPWMIKLADGHYPVEIGRARQRLSWEPRHRLGDDLPEMIRRLKADPVGWFKRNRLPVPEELTEAMDGRR